jgi:Heterokaryon incompatibility protein (HET)
MTGRSLLRPILERGGSSRGHEADSGPGMMQPEEQEACRLHLSRLSPISRQWLEACIAKHSPTCLEFPKVSSEARFLPGRLIDIGPVAELRTPCLRDTEKDNIEDCRHVALSHVWGSPDEATWLTMTTTTSTLASRMKGICISTLPKVLRDALIVCHHLKVRYLWIDSLCVLQVGLAKLCNRDWIVLTSVGFR